MKTNLTGVVMRKQCGLETYLVVVHGVIAHTFMSKEFAESKLKEYERKLAA